jgi:hypothetical protein
MYKGIPDGVAPPSSLGVYLKYRTCTDVLPGYICARYCMSHSAAFKKYPSNSLNMCQEESKDHDLLTNGSTDTDMLITPDNYNP